MAPSTPRSGRSVVSSSRRSCRGSRRARHPHTEGRMRFDLEELQHAYRLDGVVFVEQALDEASLSLAQAAFEWSVAHPGPAAGRPFEGTDGEFYQDLCNPAAPRSPHYQRLLRETP